MWDDKCCICGTTLFGNNKKDLNENIGPFVEYLKREKPDISQLQVPKLFDEINRKKELIGKLNNNLVNAYSEIEAMKQKSDKDKANFIAQNVRLKEQVNAIHLQQTRDKETFDKNITLIKEDYKKEIERLKNENEQNIELIKEDYGKKN